MPRSFQLSEEHERFCSLMKCPLCNKFPIIPTYFQSNGTRLRRNTTISDMDILTTAKCPRCQQSWSVFNSTQADYTNCSQPNISTNRTYSRDILEVSNFKIIEASRVEEALGSDRRTIDNSRGTGSITRKLTLTKEWSKTYIIDFEKAAKANIEGGFNLPKLLNLKTTIEGSIRNKYSISENTKNIYSDEISVTIEPESKATYCFKWKRIWQNGMIKCLDQVDREIALIPFKVVVDLTFDLITE